MSDLDIIRQCLLVSDAPESVWRPALHSLQMDMEQARIDNLSAFALLEKLRTSAEHGLPIHLVVESRLAKAAQDAKRVEELEYATLTTGNIIRLIEEITAELKPGNRWSYWKKVIESARHEHHRNEAAFDDQSRELEIAVTLLEELGSEHALEFRRRTYPTLYPRPDEPGVGSLGRALINSTREK